MEGSRSGTVIYYVGLGWLGGAIAVTVAYPFVDVDASSLQLAGADLINVLVAIPMLVAGRRLRTAELPT